MAGGSSGPRLTSTRSNPYDRSFSAGLQIRFLAGPAAKESIGPLSGPQRVEHLKFVGGEKSFRQSFHVHIVADLFHVHADAVPPREAEQTQIA